MPTAAGSSGNDCSATEQELRAAPNRTTSTLVSPAGGLRILKRCARRVGLAVTTRPPTGCAHQLHSLSHRSWERCCRGVARSPLSTSPLTTSPRCRTIDQSPIRPRSTVRVHAIQRRRWCRPAPRSAAWRRPIHCRSAVGLLDPEGPEMVAEEPGRSPATWTEMPLSTSEHPTIESVGAGAYGRAAATLVAASIPNEPRIAIAMALLNALHGHPSYGEESSEPSATMGLGSPDNSGYQLAGLSGTPQGA